VSCLAVWQPGSPFTVNFSDGPGIAKDYIGIFRAGAEFGVGQQGALVDYLYFGGLSNGSVTFQNTPPPGDYVVGLFTNDSYTNVSNMATFSVPQPPALTLQNAEMSGGQMRLTLPTKNGKTYLIQRSQTLVDWETVQTIAGDGTVRTLSATPGSMERSFFRVVEQ
jgi:hypothetical protein